MNTFIEIIIIISIENAHAYKKTISNPSSSSHVNSAANHRRSCVASRRDYYEPSWKVKNWAAAAAISSSWIQLDKVTTCVGWRHSQASILARLAGHRPRPPHPVGHVTTSMVRQRHHTTHRDIHHYHHHSQLVSPFHKDEFSFLRGKTPPVVRRRREWDE